MEIFNQLKNGIMKYSSREDIIVLILFAILALIIPAGIILRHFFGMDPVAVLKIHWGRTVVGFIFTFLAAVTCLLNAYLGFYIPWRYRREEGGMAGGAHTSGLPLIGGLFLFVAGVLMPPSVALGIFFLLLYAVDGYGLPWFFISLTRDGV